MKDSKHDAHGICDTLKRLINSDREDVQAVASVFLPQIIKSVVFSGCEKATAAAGESEALKDILVCAHNRSAHLQAEGAHALQSLPALSQPSVYHICKSYFVHKDLRLQQEEDASASPVSQASQGCGESARASLTEWSPFHSQAVVEGALRFAAYFLPKMPAERQVEYCLVCKEMLHSRITFSAHMFVAMSIGIGYCRIHGSEKVASAANYAIEVFGERALFDMNTVGNILAEALNALTIQ